MKIKQLQRKGENLYSLTYETGFIFKRVITRDVTIYGHRFIFADNGKRTNINIDFSLTKLINHLNGYEPLKINE